VVIARRYCVTAGPGPMRAARCAVVYGVVRGFEVRRECNGGGTGHSRYIAGGSLLFQRCFCSAGGGHAARTKNEDVAAQSVDAALSSTQLPITPEHAIHAAGGSGHIGLINSACAP
jgi:hypothetical protein